MATRKLREATKKIVAYNSDYKCAHCDKKLPPSHQIDHIVPFSISNDDSSDNLQALCANCHSKKTQVENYRILKYKQLKESCNEYNLCWFCLETYSMFDKHNCSKIVKNIDDLLRNQR